ncbi:bifunctional helix-turn-helix transcriptional regulator/GNAT family N-acetyltransferase [Flavobacterium sp. GSB-24]|uniref:bifunctional helix-turn-helix transcriptional regulator/GNAT family N-acetyltransferase n=1 Tax=Flavobacterium sp. GSB-24 TaxID=2994319 RepID=UPI0024939520|nr:bifunctional helix-turn-helix transcriptional regulator/GNAT family N-acetyltransferase [Flavobacterium sp. GSB-24]BDU26146.1 putative HTH-type DNA-binding domain-containing acetyltransferase YbfA [Flavobacterium sp. GSB-24]
MKNISSEIRSFNRFYTAHLDILNQNYLDSNYSLTEVRIIYEINEKQDITAQEICETLNLDKGYLSRLLKRLTKDGVIEKVPSVIDKRAFNIKLTSSGNKLLQKLNAIADQQSELKVKNLSTAEQEKLVNAMGDIKKMLDSKNSSKISASDISYRYDLRPGDIGYIIYLHSKIYDQESSFSNEFEFYVVKTFYHFLEQYSPEKDRLWMAEYNNQIIGCIAIVHQNEQEAQLRWFLSDPSFRGLGIGKKLLNDAIAFCREKRYKNVFLLTTDKQERALDMYKTAGFKLTNSQEVNQWGATFRDERYDMEILE